YMSLWSYESQILLLLLFPLVLLVCGVLTWRRAAPFLVPWYALPALYATLTVLKYQRSAGLTYQESVIRKSFALRDLLGDLLFNVTASVEFWRWPDNRLYALHDWRSIGLPLAASCVFVCGGLVVAAMMRDRGPLQRTESAATWWSALGIGSL